MEASIGNQSCGSTTVNSAGEWSISVPTNAPCDPTTGANVTFTISGAAATVTPAAKWEAGGLPPDVPNGYVLRPAAAPTPGPGAPTATGTVAPPKTGSGGTLGAGSTAGGAAALGALVLLATGVVLGARVASTRVR